jgi:PRTRC genetic system protein E
MKLISPFKSLIQGGVILTFKISAAGGDRVQLDILPQGKDSATGVSLPPKALVGTPEEIDAGLEEYLPKYAGTVARVADVVANAESELKTLEEAAAAQAKKAVEDKSKAKTNTPKAGSKPASSAPRKDMSAGLLDDDDGGDDDNDGGMTLMTTGGAGQAQAPTPASGPADAPAPAAPEGVSPDLFNV